VASQTKAKEGLEALVGFYANDPVQQKKAEQEISDSQQKINRYVDAQKMVHSQLDAIVGGSYDYSSSYSSPSASLKVRGLYDYTATCETELSFKQGDILTVTERDDSGWWYAELNGVSGFVPNNYVEQQ